MRSTAQPQTRDVKCYHCGGRCVLSVHARSATCPSCYRGLVLDDLVIGATRWVGKVHTCGRVVIEQKGKLIASEVVAMDGVECLGSIQASITTRGEVHIGPKGRLMGDCRAGALVVDRGGEFTGGNLTISPA